MRHPLVPPRRWTAGLALAVLAWPAIGAPPTQPGALRAQVYSNTAAELFWERSSDEGGVVGYEVRLNGQRIGQFDALSYFSDSLITGQQYRAEVQAVDTDGERSVVATTTFTAGQRGNTPTTPTTTPPSGQAPAAAVNLRGIAYSRTAFEFFWDRQSVPGLRYRVLLDGTLLQQTDGISAYVGGLERGREYQVEIITVDAAGNTSAPAVATLTSGSGSTPGTVTVGATASPGTPAPSGGAPAAPAGLRIDVYSNTAAELFWERPAATSGVVRYRVQRDGDVVRETAGISYFDATRTPGQRHRYEVVALNAAGQASSPSVVIGDGGSSGPVVPPVTPPVTPPTTPTTPSGDVFPASATDIAPDTALYQQDGYAQLDAVRVDLRTDTVAGVCTDDDESGCTLDDVLADIDKNDELTVDIPVHFSAEDFADDGSSSNAELRQRGGGSRFAPQKSFRVKLDSKEVLWRNERFLQLNKHPYESSRFRNKLAFDLMQDVPHLPSFRTQFVNLWIDDGNGPVDQGLYTHVERINDDWLKRRGLDGDGNLYKAEDFRFAASDLKDVAVDEEGEPLDEDRFESSIEIEEGKDHRALFNMIAAIQDPSLDTATVIERHFNSNNVLAWATFNILVKQDDATRHNFILYNPAGTERFYFLPWDYDAVFGEWELPPDGFSEAALRKRLDYGYALGHRNDFLSRYYRMPGTHERILAAAALLREDVLSEARIAEASRRYYEVTAPFQIRAPDAQFNEFHNAASGQSFARKVGANEDALRGRFAIPMPPTLQPVDVGATELRVSWMPAYDVTGNTLSYELQVATSADFAPGTQVLQLDGIDGERREQRIDRARLGSGQFYVRLIARAASDPARYWQVARNAFEDGDAIRYGVVEFQVP